MTQMLTYRTYNKNPAKPATVGFTFSFSNIKITYGFNFLKPNMKTPENYSFSGVSLVWVTRFELATS